MAEHHLCGVEQAASLEGPLRRLIHNPHRLLRGHLQEGMRVLDLGCGPGLFSIEAARLVGKKGEVVAADVQQGMLDLVRERIQTNPPAGRISLHKSSKRSLNLHGTFDFILAFYVIHELADRKKGLQELARHLRPGAKMLIIEPIFEVGRREFCATITDAQAAGLEAIGRPFILMSRARLLARTAPADSRTRGRRAAR